jgi:hypothetical protein
LQPSRQVTRQSRQESRRRFHQRPTAIELQHEFAPTFANKPCTGKDHPERACLPLVYWLAKRIIVTIIPSTTPITVMATNSDHRLN